MREPLIGLFTGLTAAAVSHRYVTVVNGGP
jgi:hypothetical protein